MKSVCVILTDHESCNENLIIKSLNYIKKSNIKKIFLIGSSKHYPILYKKINKIKKIKFINEKLDKKNYFKYLNNITDKSLKLLEDKKINYLINMPLNKKKFFKDKYNGFTEFFSYKINSKHNENMLMYNDLFSVCPITTHVKIKDVPKNISKKKIIKTVSNINFFYKKILNEKPKFVVLGLNPHASIDMNIKNEDNLIIKPAVNYLKKNYNIVGPVSADTAFNSIKKNMVFIGMYHDQVLTPFKLLNKFNGINITVGLKYLRITPDHGPGNKKIPKSKINHLSFIKSLDFCKKF